MTRDNGSPSTEEPKPSEPTTEEDTSLPSDMELDSETTNMPVSDHTMDTSLKRLSGETDQEETFRILESNASLFRATPTITTDTWSTTLATMELELLSSLIKDHIAMLSNHYQMVEDSPSDQECQVEELSMFQVTSEVTNTTLESKIIKPGMKTNGSYSIQELTPLDGGRRETMPSLTDSEDNTDQGTTLMSDHGEMIHTKRLPSEVEELLTMLTSVSVPKEVTTTTTDTSNSTHAETTLLNNGTLILKESTSQDTH